MIIIQYLLNIKINLIISQIYCYC